MRYTFSNYNDNTHTDWLSYDNVGIDAPAYLLTGYLSGGDYQRDKQLVYMTTHFKKTEIPVPPMYLENRIGTFLFGFAVDFQYNYTGGVAPVTMTSPTFNVDNCIFDNGHVTGYSFSPGASFNYNVVLTDADSNIEIFNDTFKCVLPTVFKFITSDGLYIYGNEQLPLNLVSEFQYIPISQTSDSLTLFHGFTYNNGNGFAGFSQTNGDIFYEANERGFQKVTRTVDRSTMPSRSSEFVFSGSDKNGEMNSNMILRSEGFFGTSPSTYNGLCLYVYDGTNFKYVDMLTFTNAVGNGIISPSAAFVAYNSIDSSPAGTLCIKNISTSGFGTKLSDLPHQSTTPVNGWALTHFGWMNNATSVYPTKDVLMYTLSSFDDKTSFTYIVDIASDGTYTLLFSGENVLGSYDEINDSSATPYSICSNPEATVLYSCVYNLYNSVNSTWLRTFSWNGSTITKIGSDILLRQGAYQANLRPSLVGKPYVDSLLDIGTNTIIHLDSNSLPTSVYQLSTGSFHMAI